MNQLNKNKTLTKIKKAILSPDFRNFKRRNQLSKSNLELRYPNFKTLSSDFPNFKRRNLAVLLSPGQKSPFLSSRSGWPQNCFWRRKNITIFNIFLQLRHILVSRKHYSVWGLRLWVWLYVLSSLPCFHGWIFCQKLYCLSKLRICLLTDISYFAIKKSGPQCAHAPLQGNARPARTMWSRFDLTNDTYKYVWMAWMIDHENILSISGLISGFDWYYQNYYQW